MRADDEDQRKKCMASSEGSVMTLITSKERVCRILSFVSSIVAIYCPSGLGNEWHDAVESP